MNGWMDGLMNEWMVNKKTTTINKQRVNEQNKMAKFLTNFSDKQFSPTKDKKKNGCASLSGLEYSTLSIIV